MENESRTWINQNIFYYRDSFYGSNNSLEISFSSSTQDFQSFSPVNLNLSVIGQNSRKTFTINYQLAVDLTKSFKLASSNMFENFSTYKTSGEKSLKIDVHQIPESKEWVSTISVIYSSSDSLLVVVPLQVFVAVANLVKDFSTSFLNLSLELYNRTLLTEITKEIKEIKSSIRSLPSFFKENKEHHKEILLENSNPSYLLQNARASDDLVLDSGETLVKDFDEFLQSNISSIEIPDLEKEIKTSSFTTTKTSTFISTVLENEISNLETLLNSLSAKEGATVLSFIDVVRRKMGLENFNFLAGLDPEEVKSAIYLSRVFFGKHMFYLSSKSKSVPKAVPVMKCRIVDKEQVRPDNIELAYDLLLLSGFVKVLKSRLEEKVVDDVTSRSFLYFLVRYFTDIITFSYLEGKDSATIKTCILSRFRNYNESGFFKKYNFLLESYSCKIVSENDISLFIDEVNSKIIGKSKFAKEVHEKSFENGELSVPFSNDFSTEQIINEVCPLEVVKLVGLNVNDVSDISRVVDPLKISDTVKNFFSKKETNVVTTRKNTKTPLVSFLEENRKEIPEEYFSSVLSYASQISTEVFDVHKFPLELMGDLVVKAIYTWNNLSDRNSEKYSQFKERVLLCLLDKKSIMSLVKSGLETKQETSSNWISLDEID